MTLQRIVAFVAYLRNLNWPHGGFILRQGDGMDHSSVITVAFTDTPGAPIKITGNTRPIIA